MSDCLCLVVPCFNEEEIIEHTCTVLSEKLESLIIRGIITSNSRICFIDDGSIDNTWSIIYNISKSNHFITGIKLSKNEGHQNALLAGLKTVMQYCEIAISIDADLQQDINAIDEFILKYENGADIVLGIRNSRKTDSAFKKFTALAFYKLMNVLGSKTIRNHADYRLMSVKAIDALFEYTEVNLFLRGIITNLGFKTDTVYFEVKERTAGKSKYNLKKMLSLALNGITSFSIKPLRMISLIGMGTFVISLFMILYFVIYYLKGITVSGWSSILCSIWLLGGLILLSLGITGEYIGKMYSETKHRPRFIVEERIGDYE